MTLDEAIKHCEEVAEKKEKQCKRISGSEDEGMNGALAKTFAECAEEHRQLAEWLKELRRLREQTEPERCGDCISRQAVLEQAKDYGSNTYLIPVNSVKALSSVTPQPKIGRWIDDKCSVCGKGTENLISSSEWYRNEDPNVCPFCGAKMEVVNI